MEAKKSEGSLTGKFVSLKFCRGLSPRGGGGRKHGERFQRVPGIFLLLLFLESLKVQSFGSVGLLLWSPLLLLIVKTSEIISQLSLLWPLVQRSNLLLLLLLLLQIDQSRELLLLITGRSKQLLLLRKISKKIQIDDLSYKCSI